MRSAKIKAIAEHLKKELDAKTNKSFNITYFNQVPADNISGDVLSIHVDNKREGGVLPAEYTVVLRLFLQFSVQENVVENTNKQILALHDITEDLSDILTTDRNLNKNVSTSSIINTRVFPIVSSEQAGYSEITLTIGLKTIKE